MTTLQTLEDQLTQEKMDRSRQHAAIIARVDSLQRTASLFDAVIRKELVERSEDSRQARPMFEVEDAVEHCHAARPKIPTDQHSLIDCLQSQARPLTKGASLPCRPRPRTTGSARVNVSYCASPARAPSPPACGPSVNHKLGPELQPASQRSRGASAQLSTVVPPTGSQSPVPRAVVRSASGTISGPQSASNTGRMSSSTVMSNRGASMVHNASFPLLPSSTVSCSSPGKCGPRQAAPSASGLCPSAQSAAQVSRKASLATSPGVRGRSLSVSPPDGARFQPGSTEDLPGFVSGSVSVPLARASCSVPMKSQACFVVTNEASISRGVEEEVLSCHGLPTNACRGSVAIPFTLVTSES